ncbi:MAG: pyruvate dehydrogenase (acetyl-transferring) E1 component subunit alpha [Cytophagales bacterium]|nr:pyruvate dehydrogenase (acetyl-transferring) E1 component subunit alpha [Cytophagales bacterium]
MAKAKTSSKFSKETYMTWYEQMLLMRRFEEKAGQLYGQQKIRGFCHLYIGQEACVAGAVSALEKDDKYITSYRDHAHPLALGTEPKRIMAELYGKATGVSKGKGGSMHMFDKEVGFVGGHGIVGGQVPLAAGLGFAEMYNETGKLCICYMGDGAVRQGAFHEALNIAMTMKIPVIFVIENNGYAMGTSVARTSNVTELNRLADSYNMPNESVDAMRPEDVHIAVEKAAKRARRGDGPTLLEFRTYRYKGHSMSDPAKYRTKEELAQYKAKDPIDHCHDVIVENKWAAEEELKAIDKRIKARVLDAVKFAEESPFPEPGEVYKDVYMQEDYPFAKD